MANKRKSINQIIREHMIPENTADDDVFDHETIDSDAASNGHSGKKVLGVVFSVLCGLVFILVIILTAVEYNIFKPSFFQAEYEKLNTAEVIGISQAELMDATEGLLDYIQGTRSDLNMEATIKGEQRQIFNQREKEHMVDVRNLYASVHRVKYQGIALFLLLLFVMFKLLRKRFKFIWAKGYLIAAALFLVLFILLALFIVLDFNRFWTYFHLVFFSNDLWQLNPQTDILIQMVPEQFFYDLVVKIVIFFAGEIALIAILAGALLKSGNKGKNKGKNKA